MVLGTDGLSWHTLTTLSGNEIELGEMDLTGGQYFTLFFKSENSFDFQVFSGVSPLRDGVDWLVSKFCSGEVYYHFISNITVFRLV